MKLPLVSSRELISALERAGWKKGKAKSGTHQVYIKNKFTVTVIINKNPVSRGTLKACLERAGISDKEFIKLLKKKK